MDSKHIQLTYLGTSFTTRAFFLKNNIKCIYNYKKRVSLRAKWMVDKYLGRLNPFIRD